MLKEKLKRLYSSSLFRSSFIYVFCDGINRAIPFLLLPFITHYLTPADYGVVTNFNVYIQILSVFCYVSTAAALPVMFHKLEKEQVKLYTSNMILLNLYSTIVCSIIALLFFSAVEKSLDISFTFQVYAIIIVWFTGITNVNMILWRCEEKPISFGIYQISQSALSAISTILFVIILLLGWKGRVYSMLFVTVLFGVISLWVLYKRGYLGFKISKEYMKATLLFGLPIIPHALSFWFKSGVDKVLLTEMCGLTANGLYSVAMTWGAIVTMFLTSFNNAYAPFLYQKLSLFDKDKEGTLDEQKKLVKLIWGSILLVFFLVIVAYIVSVFLIKMMYASSYYPSLDFLPYVMITQFFNGCYLMFVCFVHYTFKTKRLGMITFSLSLLQVGMSYVFIKYMGAVGAALSSAITGAMIFLFVAHYAMKVYKLPWFSFKKI